MKHRNALHSIFNTEPASDPANLPARATARPSRRDVMKFGAMAMLAAGGTTACATESPMQSGTLAQPSEPRFDQRIDRGWRFLKQGFPGAQAVDLDDTAWDKVDLPHTYNGLDGQTGAPYYRGPAWYRRELFLPREAADDPNKQFCLYFEGAGITTKVYCNGRAAGGHIGLFAGFCVDITPFVNRTGRNIVAVRVDNAYNNHIAPLNGDFNLDGGLYRHVRLLALDALAISPLDDGGPGVYIKQVRVTPEKAHLEITAMLRNAASDEKHATLRYTILDHAEKEVLRASASQKAPGGETTACVQTMVLEHPHLWNGREDPYLYKVKVEVFNAGRCTDVLTQPLGVRFFHIDPDRGFFLNGKSYPLRGVCTHEDRPNVGRAVSDADYREDLQIIHEIGATCVRMAHYQHAQPSYDAADKLGLVVWAEDGLVNGVAHNEEFDNNQLQQVRELIKQNFNHPSICFWSMFNELGNNGQENLGVHLVEKINAEARRLDPTRPTTAADDQGPENPVGYITDIIAFNRYPGWYGGRMTEFAEILDGIRSVVEAKAPHRCIGMSEYGAGASIFQHETHVTQPNPGAYWHPEEYQALLHEHAWAAIKARPWLWGTFLWVMFDFASAFRHEGDHPGKNDKGLVTRDRKTRKDAFYFYKAQWTTKPFVYITDRRFKCRPDKHAVFKVYSTCQRVELWLNGRSLGEREGVDGVFVWPETELRPGQNRIRAVGRHAGVQVKDFCTIVHDPRAPHHATYR
jgi:beta-galactosidase